MDEEYQTASEGEEWDAGLFEFIVEYEDGYIEDLNSSSPSEDEVRIEERRKKKKKKKKKKKNIQKNYKQIGVVSKSNVLSLVHMCLAACIYYLHQNEPIATPFNCSYYLMDQVAEVYFASTCFPLSKGSFPLSLSSVSLPDSATTPYDVSKLILKFSNILSLSIPNLAFLSLHSPLFSQLTTLTSLTHLSLPKDLQVFDINSVPSVTTLDSKTKTQGRDNLVKYKAEVMDVMICNLILQLTALQSLSLPRHCILSNSVLTTLSQSTNLTDLRIPRTKITPDSLSLLSSVLNKLSRFKLKWTSLSFLIDLNNFRGVDYLFILSNIAKLTRLELCVINESNKTPHFKYKVCPPETSMLQSFSIQSVNEIPEHLIDRLFNSLRIVKLRDSKIYAPYFDTIGINSPVEYLHLKNLDLSCARFQDFESFSNLSKLSHLKIRNIFITEDSEMRGSDFLSTVFVSLPASRLQYLSIQMRRDYISSEGISLLTNLRILSISGYNSADFSTFHLNTITLLENLTHLRLFLPLTVSNDQNERLNILNFIFGDEKKSSLQAVDFFDKKRSAKKENNNNRNNKQDLLCFASWTREALANFFSDNIENNFLLQFNNSFLLAKFIEHGQKEQELTFIFRPNKKHSSFRERYKDKLCQRISNYFFEVNEEYNLSSIENCAINRGEDPQNVVVLWNIRNGPHYGELTNFNKIMETLLSLNVSVATLHALMNFEQLNQVDVNTAQFYTHLKTLLLGGLKFFRLCIVHTNATNFNNIQQSKELAALVDNVFAIIQSCSRMKNNKLLLSSLIIEGPFNLDTVNTGLPCSLPTFDLLQNVESIQNLMIQDTRGEIEQIKRAGTVRNLRYNRYQPQHILHLGLIQQISKLNFISEYGILFQWQMNSETGGALGKIGHFRILLIESKLVVDLREFFNFCEAFLAERKLSTGGDEVVRIQVVSDDDTCYIIQNEIIIDNEENNWYHKIQKHKNNQRLQMELRTKQSIDAAKIVPVITDILSRY